jgi:hypothetical protein
MTLKLKPPNKQTLNAGEQDLTQEMAITNSMDGQKPIALKLKINYTHSGTPVSQIKVVNDVPVNA